MCGARPPKVPPAETSARRSCFIDHQLSTVRFKFTVSIWDLCAISWVCESRRCSLGTKCKCSCSHAGQTHGTLTSQTRVSRLFPGGKLPAEAQRIRMNNILKTDQTESRKQNVFFVGNCVFVGSCWLHIHAKNGAAVAGRVVDMSPVAQACAAGKRVTQ